MTAPPRGNVGRIRELPVFPVHATPVRPDVAPTVAPAAAFAPPVEGPEDGPRIALVTLGCDKNTVDSERMMAALVGQGARVGVEPDEADVVIVNTCGFIDVAKEESIDTLLTAAHLKSEGKLRAVVAVGCLVQRYQDDLEREIPEVDLYMGLTELQGLVPELKRRGLLPEEPPALPLMERPLRVLSGETRHTSFLKISEGCDHSCSFCAIPMMRGLHRSAPLDELVAEAQALGAAGVRELNIISQDTTWYGRDLRRRDRGAPLLPDLLRALLDRTEIAWYRLFYMYPSGITPEVVELLAEGARRRAGPRLLPYLDLPLQHGADRILKAMRRPERRETILEKVRWLRDAVPDITLRTTVIVGFPGETDGDFRELLDLLEEIEFDRVGAFAYSIEEGTRAAELPGHLDPELKQERLEELLDVQRGISFEKNLAQVGTRHRLLVDRRLEGDDADPDFVAMGRTEGQAADVDGATQLLPVEGWHPEPGTFVEVEIVDALDHDLIGKVVTT